MNDKRCSYYLSNNCDEQQRQQNNKSNGKHFSLAKHFPEIRSVQQTKA